uniref:Putative secreted peptide n=1 Tax=Anopheles braziliensis TaxID=58242 RepID=A0A2M3ZTT7_9DIPT
MTSRSARTALINRLLLLLHTGTLGALRSRARWSSAASFSVAVQLAILAAALDALLLAVRRQYRMVLLAVLVDLVLVAATTGCQDGLR